MNCKDSRPSATDTAPFVLTVGQLTVTRDQILSAMAEFDEKDLRDRPKIGDKRKGWWVEENGRRYNPKWVLKLATNVSLTKFHNRQARETLGALGFELRCDRDRQYEKSENRVSLNRNDDDHEEADDVDQLHFDSERNLQKALRANIGQLEAGLKITDGGKEQRVEYREKDQLVECGQIDITAEDEKGTVVVIELKAGKAGRHALGQILGYMGALTDGKKPTRGILVAERFSPKAMAAARVIPNLELRTYSFRFVFENGGTA
ncbi:MAG: endonuclease NucS domain-containing protein [Candidatus Acidiferrales bacterium]